MKSIYGSPKTADEMEDIEDSVVASVLTDALTRYMRYLEVEQELHESSQLRQGKGVETSTDLARTEYFHRKTVATESCLLVVGQITENVRRWVTGGEVVKDVGHRKEKQVEFGSQDESLIDLNGELTSLPGRGFQTTREDEDEEPYINPMTGQWITPATSRSAGPSNNQGLYKARSRKPSFDYSLEVKVPFHRTCDVTNSSKVDAFQSSPPVKVGETLIPNVLADLKRCTNFRVQPEGEISLLPQTSITPNLLDLDDDNPPPYDILIPGVILPLTNLFVHPMLSSSYPSPTPGSNTLNTSPRETDSATEDTFSDCDYEGQQVAHLQFERVLGDGNLRNTLQLAFSLENSTTRRQFDLDRLAAQNLQTQFDNEVQQSPSSQNQDGYTRQMEQEERIRVLDIDAEMEAARRLASEWEAQDGIYEQGLMYLRGKWEKEDRMLEAQVSFADSLRRSEEARDEAIRRDRAAAMAAQHQWEEEVRESEDSARRLVEEIKREEEEEEEERERMRAAAEAAKRIAEELERQEEEELQRLAAEAAEAERRERQADCVVCMEPSDKVNMCLLSCEHYYCGECIVGAFFFLGYHC